MIWFGMVWFYGILTIVGYIMPNPFYTYISNIWYLKHFVNKIFKRACVHFLHTVKWFHLFLSNMNNSIYY